MSYVLQLNMELKWVIQKLQAEMSGAFNFLN